MSDSPDFLAQILQFAQPIGTFTTVTASGNAPASGTYPAVALPSGYSAIVAVLEPTNATVLLTVTGTATPAEYINGVTIPVSPISAFPYVSALDPQVAVGYIWSGGTFTIHLWAVTAAMAVALSTISQVQIVGGAQNNATPPEVTLPAATGGVNGALAIPAAAAATTLNVGASGKLLKSAWLDLDCTTFTAAGYIGIQDSNGPVILAEFYVGVVKQATVDKQFGPGGYQLVGQLQLFRDNTIAGAGRLTVVGLT